MQHNIINIGSDAGLICSAIPFPKVREYLAFALSRTSTPHRVFSFRAGETRYHLSDANSIRVKILTTAERVDGMRYVVHRGFISLVIMAIRERERQIMIANEWKQGH